jgi:hypothetical protein
MKQPSLPSWPAALGGLCALLTTAASSLVAAPNPLDINLTPIGRFTNNAPFNLSASEIVAHDPARQRLFVVNARDVRLDVLDIRNPAQPTLAAMVDLSAYGPVVNSVAVQSLDDEGDDDDDDGGVNYRQGLIAAAVEAPVKTSPGTIVLLDQNLNIVNVLPAGALPDMLTFSRNGRWLLSANEGEPNTYNDFAITNNGPSIDPEGSVTIVDLVNGPASPVVRTVTFAAFNGVPIDPRIRIFGPNATVSQDLEPEYLAISDDSRTAWITLQENNALAILDIRAGVFTSLVGLGFKNHNLPGTGLDGSDQDGKINIRPWPINGIYCPDTIDAYKYHGDTFLVTANEGDTREYPGFREDVRLSTRTLDPMLFPDAAFLKANTNLGRLAVSSVDGDLDGDGDLDEIYSYGGRSFTIWTAAGVPVFDSGDELEQLTAAVYPMQFNASHSNNTFDNRSPSKGPEPEGLVIGKAYGRTLAFISLERIGGVVVYDISNPFNPEMVDYVNTRNFAGSFNFATSGDLGPEGLCFIPASKSPNRKPLLALANEVSGSTVIFQINRKASRRNL